MSHLDNSASGAVEQKLEDKLKLLISSMDEQQQLRFKQAVVKQAINYIERLLPPEEKDDGHRIGINMAHKWLETPTKETALWVGGGVAAEKQDGGARYFDYPPYFLDPAVAALPDDVWIAAQIAVWVGLYAKQGRVFYKSRKLEQEGDRPTAAIIKLARLEWQIAAAQSILNLNE